jgi:hypothetical protein
VGALRQPEIKTRFFSPGLLFSPTHPVTPLVAAVEAMKKITLTLVCLFGIAPFAHLIAGGLSDTPENRRREAERYLQATPPKAMFADLAEKAAANVPAEARPRFVQMMTSALDIDALTKAMINAMVKHFTADELAALADFYGSPVGKSAMSKFGLYMADVMPAIQEEMLKAQTKMNQSEPNK